MIINIKLQRKTGPYHCPKGRNFVSLVDTPGFVAHCLDHLRQHGCLCKNSTSLWCLCELSIQMDPHLNIRAHPIRVQIVCEAALNALYIAIVPCLLPILYLATQEILFLRKILEALLKEKKSDKWGRGWEKKGKRKGKGKGKEKRIAILRTSTAMLCLVLLHLQLLVGKSW